jgi:chromosome segregation ATPase
MCQSDPPLRSVEETSDVLSGAAAILERQPNDSLAIAGVEARMPGSDFSSWLNGLSSDQLLVVLGAIGLLIVIAAWYLDDVNQRIEWEIYRFKEWWRWRKENASFRFGLPRISNRLGLSSSTDACHLDSPQPVSVPTTFEAVRQPVSSPHRAEEESDKSDQADLQFETLASELAQVKESEREVRLELTTAREQLKQLGQQQQDERELRDSELGTLKSHLADQTAQNENLQTLLAETTARAEQLVTSLEESNLRVREVNEEMSALEQVDQQNTTCLAETKKEVEQLLAQSVRFEKELEAANQKVLDKADLADRLLMESDQLKSSLERVESRCADQDAKADEVSKTNLLAERQLQEKIDKGLLAIKELEAELVDRESQLVVFRQEVSSLKSVKAADAEGAQRKIDELSSDLSLEEARCSQLKERSIRDEEELSLQSSTLKERECRINLMMDEATNSSEELAETLRLLERERSLSEEATEVAQKSEEQVLALSAENSELKGDLEKLQHQSDEAERKSAEVQVLLKNEQELRSRLLGELESTRNLVQQLEQEADAPKVEVADYHRIVNKLIKYKKAYHKIKALVDELVVQKSEMSGLASEYLAMAKTIRHELEEERSTNRELKSKIDKLSAAAVSFDEAELRRQAAQLARDHVLDLKSQFEEKLKQKNELIREIRKRQLSEASTR